MIDIKGQVRVVFHISDWKVEGGHWVNVIDPNFKDFLSFEQLLTFTIIEEAGNVLPTFRLEMKLIEEEIIKRFNEGCVLTMSYGRDDQHMKTSYLRIMRMDTYPVGNIERAVMLRGFVDAMGWLNTTHCDYYPNMTAIEVIQATAGQFFRVDTNGLVSQDRMTWIQPNISFKRFINEVWMHMNLPNDVPLVAITMDKRFIVKGINQLEKVDWYLTYGDLMNRENYIPYQGGYSLEARSGFFNSWFGYGRRKKVFEWESGNTQFYEEDAKVFLAQAKSLNRQANIKPRYDNASFINDNVHPDYWNAFLKNMAYLVSGSNVKLSCRVVDYYFDVTVLDSVLFLDSIQGVGKDQTKYQAQQFVSGRYVVSKVVRNISNKQYSMMLELSKETVNEERGDLR